MTRNCHSYVFPVAQTSLAFHGTTLRSVRGERRAFLIALTLWCDGMALNQADSVGKSPFQ